MAKEINKPEGEVSGDNGEDVHAGSGNIGLPFGLCKKYGIALPKGAMPRDAWAALKGKGIYPPWTDKGKDQYDDNGDNGGEPPISEAQRKVYESLRNHLSAFSGEYRKSVEGTIEALDDDELNVVNDGLSSLSRIIKGSGSARGSIIEVPEGEGNALDKELGFDFRATCFYHELGHRVDHIYGKHGRNFSASQDANAAYLEDIRNLGAVISKEMGVKPITTFDRLTTEQKLGIVKWVSKVARENEIPPRPHLFDYIKREPRMPYFSQIYEEGSAEYNVLYQRYQRYGYQDDDIKSEIERKNRYAKDELARYDKEKKEYDEWVSKGFQEQKQKEYDAAMVEYKKKKKEVEPDLIRSAVVSDFIGGYTGGRVDPCKEHVWGHTANYHSKMKQMGQFGTETFAEYTAARMTKDTKQLDMFKKYLPKTVEYYEKAFKEGAV